MLSGKKEKKKKRKKEEEGKDKIASTRIRVKKKKIRICNKTQAHNRTHIPAICRAVAPLLFSLSTAMREVEINIAIASLPIPLLAALCNTTQLIR